MAAVNEGSGSLSVTGNDDSLRSSRHQLSWLRVFRLTSVVRQQRHGVKRIEETSTSAALASDGLIESGLAEHAGKIQA